MRYDWRFVYEVKDTYHDGTEQFTARVVYVLQEDGSVRNPRSSDTLEQSGVGALRVAAFADLGVTAYRHRETSLSDWYGWHVEYLEPFRVNLAQAERQVALLRRVDKALSRFETQLGSCADLAGFCGRVARAVGSTTDRPFSQHHTELSVTGSHYRWVDIDQLRHDLESATVSG